MASSTALLTGRLRLKCGASAPSAITHFAFGSMLVSSSKVESMTPVHSAHERRPLHVGLDWFFRKERRAVAAAFDECYARHHRITRQRIECEDERLFHQTMDYKTVLIRIDIGIAGMRNDKVQRVRSERAVE